MLVPPLVSFSEKGAKGVTAVPGHSPAPPFSAVPEPNRFPPLKLPVVPEPPAPNSGLGALLPNAEVLLLLFDPNPPKVLPVVLPAPKAFVVVVLLFEPNPPPPKPPTVVGAAVLLLLPNSPPVVVFVLDPKVEVLFPNILLALLLFEPKPVAMIVSI